jgi:hypothetical protein
MNFLLYLSTVEQIVTVTIVFSGLSVLGLYIVRILVPLATLKKNHEVAGFTFGVLGAFYGLLLAFVIVAAWERFDRANANVEEEGVALISLYRLSKGFSAPTASDMQHAIRVLHPSADRRRMAGHGELEVFNYRRLGRNVAAMADCRDLQIRGSAPNAVGRQEL